jgi:hypothetical protein
MEETFFTVTPLLQTRLLPLLIHVYFMPFTVEVALNLVHLAPAFTTAAFAGAIPSNETAMRTANTLRMSKY